LARPTRLTQLSSPGLDALIRETRLSRKTLVALLPIGSVEQHGPLLPLGSDTILAEGMATSLAENWNEDSRSAWAGLVLPALPYANVDSAVGFPGSLTIPHQAQREYGSAVLRAALTLDVGALVVVNGHGPNDSWLVEAAFLLNQESMRDHDGARPPVLPAMIGRAMRPAYAALDLPEGKHADWLEFCLVYSLVGPRLLMGREKALSEQQCAQGPVVDALPGVPLGRRSPSGVLGTGWPSGQTLEDLAPKAWDFAFGVLKADIETRLQDSRHVCWPPHWF